MGELNVVVVVVVVVPCIGVFGGSISNKGGEKI
jgi:hypothetical protein